MSEIKESTRERADNLYVEIWETKLGENPIELILSSLLAERAEATAQAQSRIAELETERDQLKTYVDWSDVDVVSKTLQSRDSLRAENEKLKNERNGWFHSSENWELMHAKAHEARDTLRTENEKLLVLLRYVFYARLPMGDKVEDCIEFAWAQRIRETLNQTRNEVKPCAPTTAPAETPGNSSTDSLSQTPSARFTDLKSGASNAAPTSEPESAATPETDYAEANTMPNMHMVHASFARNLERERDSALKALNIQRSNYERLANAILGEGTRTSAFTDPIDALAAERERAEKTEAECMELKRQLHVYEP